MRRLYAGFGCRRGCPVEELAGLLEDTFERQGLPLTALAAIASIDLKYDEPGLHALAQRLGVPLQFFSAQSLAPFEPMLSHRSALSHAHSGCHGVAESAALALAAGEGAKPALCITRTLTSRASLAVAWAAPSGG